MLDLLNWNFKSQRSRFWLLFEFCRIFHDLRRKEREITNTALILVPVADIDAESTSPTVESERTRPL